MMELFLSAGYWLLKEFFFEKTTAWSVEGTPITDP